VKASGGIRELSGISSKEPKAMAPAMALSFTGSVNCGFVGGL
jgi:hypothetical protein